MASLHKGRSEVWTKGSVWYEHRIVMPEDSRFGYHLLNTPAQLSLMDKSTKQYDFDKSDDRDAYWDAVYVLAAKEGCWSDVGTPAVMRPAYEVFKGTMLDSIKEMINKTHVLQWSREQYASRIVHLMLYPKDGELAVESVKAIKIK